MGVTLVSWGFGKIILGTTLFRTIRLYLPSSLALIRCPLRQLSTSINKAGNEGRFTSLSPKFKASDMDVNNPPIQKGVVPRA